jgi:hypothetical protein
LICRCEEKSAVRDSTTRTRGFLHLYIGEQAVAVAVIATLTPEDAVMAMWIIVAVSALTPAASLSVPFLAKIERIENG